jgi:hypothetical protein
MAENYAANSQLAELGECLVNYTQRRLWQSPFQAMKNLQVVNRLD